MSLAEHVRRIAAEGTLLRQEFFAENEQKLLKAAEIIHCAVVTRQKLLIFGNGGSAADAQHMAAEFVGRFRWNREPLAAIALTTDSSAVTAIANDYGFQHVFGRQIRGLGNPGDIAIGITTSGKSLNVCNGICEALNNKLVPIVLTGYDDISGIEGADILQIKVPSRETARIQELHIAAIHTIAELIDYRLGVAD